ncbi:MAG: hypothetical protein ACFE9R_06585 [Candidatus Hermodarchaeota archaeon]
MRILIKRIIKREYNIEETIGQFKNGLEFKILDRMSSDITKMINEEIECLLLAKLFRFPKTVESKHTFLLLEGIYIGEYVIPNKWKIGSLFELDSDWHNFTYHAIQTELGIFVIRSSNLNHYNVKVGDSFKFRVIEFELMAWEPIKGEREIDALIYEKNIINKFWDLLESTRKECNQNAKLQKDLIHKELLNWTYDDIALFGSILNHLVLELRSKEDLKLLFRDSVDRWGHFCRGIIALGRKAFKDALFDLPEFHHDIMDGFYAKIPKDIESPLYLVQDVVEEKSGKSIQVVETSYFSEKIQYREKMIYRLLNEEFKIKWNNS